MLFHNHAQYYIIIHKQQTLGKSLETSLNLSLKERFEENCKNITCHSKYLLICGGGHEGIGYLIVNLIQGEHLEILAFYLVLLIVWGFCCSFIIFFFSVEHPIRIRLHRLFMEG